MEYLTYFIISANVLIGIIGVIFAVVKNFKDLITDAENSIKDEYASSFSEFYKRAETFIADTSETEPQIERFKKLMYSTVIDINKIESIKIRYGLFKCFVGIIISVSSILIVLLLSSKNAIIFINAKQTIYIFALMLIFSVLFFIKMHGYGDYLKEINNKYRRREY